MRTKTKKPRVNQTSYRALDHLFAGGKLIGRRTFPHPMRFHLVSHENQIIESGTPSLSLAAVSKLTEEGWCGFIPTGQGIHKYDVIEYILTPDGIDAYLRAPETKKKARERERGQG